ncbi:MAG TPA: tetratricopeptide repeat protein [Spirochaetota bacterium]|nr:tetratricopeptide repeat protein [Spirochaetota bacterium]
MNRLVLISLLLLAACGSSEEAIELYRSGMKEFSARKLAEAEKCFLMAIDKDPDLLNARLMLCKIYYYNGDFKSAVDSADFILDEDPDHANALYWKARSLVMSGDGNNGAVDLLTRSLEIDGHNIQARLLLGMIYEKNSQYTEALHQYLAVQEEEEGIIAARGNLALLYRGMGVYERYKSELAVAERMAESSGKSIKRIKLLKDEAEEIK